MMFSYHCSARRTPRSLLLRLETLEERTLPAVSPLSAVVEPIKVGPVAALVRDLDGHPSSPADFFKQDGSSRDDDGDVRQHGHDPEKQTGTGERKSEKSDKGELDIDLSAPSSGKHALSVPPEVRTTTTLPAATLVGPALIRSYGDQEQGGDMVDGSEPTADSATAAEIDKKDLTSHDNNPEAADVWEGLARQYQSSAEQNARQSQADMPDLSDAFASTAFELPRSAVETRTFRFRILEEDPDLNLPLESITEVNVSVPDDGSPGFNAPSSLLTGSRLLPQQGSDVTSVATRLGDATAPDSSATGATGTALSQFLVNPQSMTFSTATEPYSESRPADRGAERATPEAENRTSLATRLGTLVLLPVLGWGIAQLRPRRKRNDRIV